MIKPRSKTSSYRLGMLRWNDADYSTGTRRCNFRPVSTYC
jgi:hypothetical protein